MSDYSLPDPLPERLPGESNNGYRHRVIPGLAELDSLRNLRQRKVTRWVRSARRNDPSLTEDDIAAIRAEAQQEWATDHPDKQARLVYLSRQVPALYADGQGGYRPNPPAHHPGRSPLGP